MLKVTPRDSGRMETGNDTRGHHHGMSSLAKTEMTGREPIVSRCLAMRMPPECCRIASPRAELKHVATQMSFLTSLNAP